MTLYQEITRREWEQSFLILEFASTFSIAASLILYQILVSLLCSLVITLGMLIGVAVKDEEKMRHQSPTCIHEFEISAFRNVTALHGIIKKDRKWYEWKHLKCPMCHSKAGVIPLEK